MGSPHNTTSARQNWRTPPYLFHWAETQLAFVPNGKQHHTHEFVLDAAADEENKLCRDYWDGTAGSSCGLKQAWRDGTWCNPPFARVAEFVNKAIREAEDHGITSCLLTTAATESRWFERAVVSGHCHRVVFLTGRVAFLHPDTNEPVKGNTAGSALLFFSGHKRWGPPAVDWIRRDSIRFLHDHATNYVNQVFNQGAMPNNTRGST